MGANRYTNAHKNLTRNEVDWDVEIYDDGGTPVGTFSISGKDGVVLREEGPSQDPLPGIYPTSVDINFTVTDAQGEFMIQDIREKDRSRFAVKVLRDSDLIFVGRFSPHNIVIENSPMPYAVRLTAQDGLASLKNDTYSSTIDTGYSGQDTFLEHISKCFDGMDVQEFYTGDFIDFTVNWYHSDMQNITTNPLESARVDHITFQKDNGDFLTRWDVLQKICTGWGARLYYAYGGFHFEQLTERDDSTFQKYVYDTSFLETASSGLDSIEWTLDKTLGTSVMAGGTFGLLDNLKSVDVLLKVDTGNLGEGLEWSYLDETEKALGTIKLESSEDFIKITSALDYRTATTITQNLLKEKHRYEIRITLKVINDTAGNTYYAFRTINYLSFFNAVYTSESYQLTTVDDLPQAGGVVEPFNMGATSATSDTLTHNFIINTLNLNSIGSIDDVFTISMKVELSQVYGQSGSDISADGDYTFQWWLKNNRIEVANSSNSSQQTIEIHHIATNDLEAERKLEIDSSFGDLANKLNGIQVYDGTDWIYSDKTWGIGTLSGTKAFALLLAQEILMIRRTSRNLYSGGIINHEYRRDARIDYDSRFWLPLKGSYSSGKDVFSGTLLEIEVQDISGTTDDEVPVTDTPPPVLTDNPLGDPPPTQTQNPSDLVTNEAIDNAAPFTVIDVVNNNGIELDQGEYVIITNLSTGLSEIVQLTAALLSGSTSITIASYTFTNEFPIGSPIQIAAVVEFIWKQERFTADATDVSNGYITVTGPLSDPSAFGSDNDYFRWVYVKRGSSEVEFSSQTVATMDDDEYGIVKATERVTFPDSWALNVGEKIRVRYKIPRY